MRSINRIPVVVIVVAVTAQFHCASPHNAFAAGEPQWCGDLTENGTTTAADALAALRRVIGEPGAASFDYNCDSQATIVDALALLRSTVGGSVDIFCDPDCASQTFRFRDVSAETGVEHSGDAWGLAWGDADGDGWPDVWLGNHAQLPMLYLNNRDGTFSDVTVDAFPDVARADRHGAAWADYDNDGDQDLFLSVGSMSKNTPNQLLENDGGVLTDRAADLGVDKPLSRGRGGLWLDWNLDRRLDLLILNERRPDALFPSSLYEQQSNGNFSDITEAVGLNVAYNARFAQLCDLTGDSLPELIVDGGRFPQRTYTLQTTPLMDVTTALGLSPRTDSVRDAAVADFDNDLRNDLFLLRRVAHSETRLVGSERLEVFLAITPLDTEHGVSFATSGPVDIFFTGSHPIPRAEIFVGSSGAHPTSTEVQLSPDDPAARGYLEHQPGVDRGIYVGFDATGTRVRFAVSVPQSDPIRRSFNIVAVSTGTITAVETLGFAAGSEFLPPKLFMFRDGKFVDETIGSGLEAPAACVSVVGGDFDNDADVDLYLVCGGNIQNHPDQMYLNDGHGHFTAVPDAAGAQGTSRGLGDSAALADYDRDGFLDLGVVNGVPKVGGEELLPSSPAGNDQLFRNNGNTNHWLEVDLEGTGSNVDAIGARLELTANGVTQLRETGCDTHLYSQSQRRVHFGLGSANRVDALRVRWPSGTFDEFTDLDGDRILHLVESTH